MTRRKTGGKGRELTFEEAMDRLEKIVRELEEAELPLEKSLEIFEEGVRLSRLLDRKLNEAEEKVEILLRDGEGKKVRRPFDPEAEQAVDEVQEDEADSDQEGLPF